jgi:peptidoglycan hydrolase FlgJ
VAMLAPLPAHGPLSGSSSAPSPKLVHAAQEFEAQMMKELLNPMTGQDSDGTDPLFGDEDGGDSSGLSLGSGSGSGGALADFASEALGQALSQRGGFGIANQIIHELSPAAGSPNPASGAAKVTSKVTHLQNESPGMRIAQ